MAKLELSPPGPGPFRLGTQFKVSAKGSTDADPGDADHFTYSWAPTFPAAANGNFGKCVDDMSEWFRCFTGDAPGQYQVSVTVSDTSGASDTASLPVPFQVLPDTMPCLGIAEPDATTIDPNPDFPTDFVVDTVDDDLDPFPNPRSFNETAKFDWFLDKRTAAPSAFALVSPNADVNKFTIAAGEFRVGDQARVRVQIRDRDTPRSQKAFELCGDDAPTCWSSPAETCAQRRTWIVNFR
jgi:hypothetical protein